MLTLKIENPEIEKIFLDGFDSNKEKFFEFIQQSYQKNLLLHSLDKSIKQVKLQQNGELPQTSLQELIDELENNTHT
ncbi:MAG: hypothetical protein ACQESP_13630 [Candidatus Muiribacteriota bacterium]